MSGEDASGRGASGGGDATGGPGAGGDEAAWRDLVARYDLPAADPGAAPWPERESLSPPAPGPGSAGSPPAPGPGSAGHPPAPGPGSAGHPPAPGPGSAGHPPAPGPGSAGHPPGADRARVIRPVTRPAADPPFLVPLAGAGPVDGAGDDALGVAGRGNAAGDDITDEHYIPPPPPPLPQLDPVAKGAWAALFGGPAYLLAATLIGWSIPGWAALLAVMAFVGGFAVVVLRLSDGRGAGPGDGAVL